jgi:uncharacterized protein (DUF488 family)
MNDQSPCQLFTLGYERRSFGEYCQLLQQHDVDILCDVRKDPVSRKPGFSKKSMQEQWAQAGITHQHYPELGVPKERRKKINTKADLKQLFEWYHKTVLPKTIATLRQLQQQLEDQKRLALTCYERDVRECHRLYVARALGQRLSDRLEVKHL